MGGPLKEIYILQDKIGKEVCTYADVVSAWRATGGLSNREKESNSTKYLENSLFKKNHIDKLTVY